MKQICRNLVFFLLASAFIILPATGMAADFKLFWDANCNVDNDLEGYFIYYKEGVSVVDDPIGAIDVYVDLNDVGFDPDNPSYQIPDLNDDVRYCFAVTAWYGNEESDMSNEVCGVNGIPSPIPDPQPEPVIIIDDGDAGSFSSGTWKVSSGADPYGTQSLYSYDAEAEYSFESKISGRYEAAIWWTFHSSRCSAVPVKIYDGDVLLKTLTVNQQKNGGRWNVLGTYDFSGNAKVVIESENSECSTNADAAKFNAVPPGSVVIDDGEPGTSLSGNWRLSGGTNPYGTQSLYSFDAGAAYTFKAMITGRYAIALWWTHYSSRCSAVPIEIYDGDSLIDTVIVNQRQDIGQWNVLGTYDFNGSASVKVISAGGNCSTCADAVLYQR